MKISHEYATQNDGQAIQLTRCSYADEGGQPMAASFHGHLYQQTVERMLMLFRRGADEQARKPAH